VEVPWARPGSGFTLLFEAMALAMIEREMPVNRVAEMLKVNPQRISICNLCFDKMNDPDPMAPNGLRELHKSRNF
jgi:hypothetical protein